jgi:peroxiredoxin
VNLHPGNVALAALLINLASSTSCRPQTKHGTGASSSASPQRDAILEQKPTEFPTAPLAAGATAFDFSALAHTGQALKLSDFLERPSVVYFCAQDKAPPCTALAGSLRDSWTDLHAHLGMVFGVSPEPSIVHDDFASEQRLPFLLLSDSDGTINKVFGLQPGTVISYLIGTDRKILHVFSSPNPSAHAAEIVGVLTTLGLKRKDYPL